MKNINKEILKQIEQENFNNKILNDPLRLRLSYYIAFKGYKEYLSTANLEGTPQSATKFNKYSKELLGIMNTDLHVVHLLLIILNLDPKESNQIKNERQALVLFIAVIIIWCFFSGNVPSDASIIKGFENTSDFLDAVFLEEQIRQWLQIIKNDYDK